MADSSADIDRELQLLDSELRRLEAEYNMFFAGRLPKPPWETRARVQAMVTRIDRLRVPNYGDRFRFTTLQSRFAAFVDLWDRGLRAREEGRAGPFMQMRAATPEPAKRADDRIVHVTTFTDPALEADKLRDLHRSLNEARAAAGEGDIPFPRFADLVKQQVSAMKEQGSPEVAFRVATKDGKVTFTARGMRGAKPQ